MGNGISSEPLKDSSLEEAQKEIQRRPLRSQKLMRIEQEEMRRLAAMAWKPPVEGAAANQVVHMEGVIQRVTFPVDDDRRENTLRLQVENKSGYDVEVGLEVNEVRQAPLRSPVEGPFAP